MSVNKSAHYYFENRNSFKRKIFRIMTPLFLREPIQKYRKKGIYKDYFDLNKCVFIHIPKNAGQSISNTLFDDKFPGHWSYRDYEWENKSKIEEYFKFCVIREPYSRLYSAYNYLKSEKCTELDKIFKEKILCDFNSFENFVLLGLKKEVIKNWIHFRTQVSFITDKNNEIKVDYICRLENIDEDFNVLKNKLDIPDVLLKSDNRMGHTIDLDELYTDDMKEIVKDVYKDDFEMLGYDS